MSWPTWQHGVTVALLAWVLAQRLERRPPSRLTATAAPALRELRLVAGLYAVWRVARSLPLAQDDGAIDRARQIVALQADLHLPSELSLQHLVLRHDWLAWATSWYYAAVHVPATVAFLVWLYVRHRHHYPHWRNGLAALTGLCLLIRFIRVAPPRFLPDLGYIDISERFGPNIYGPVGTGVSDQFAAMPSIHVGWAAVVSLGIVAASTSRWRGLAVLHLVATFLAVAASGNHWWLDGIVAIGLLGVALAADTAIRSAREQGRRSLGAGRANPLVSNYATGDHAASRPGHPGPAGARRAR